MDIAQPLRERLAELDRQLDALEALNDERERILGALAALERTNRKTRASRQNVLGVLQQGGRMTPKSIASELGCEVQSVYRQLKRLHEQALVDRHKERGGDEWEIASEQDDTYAEDTEPEGANAKFG